MKTLKDILPAALSGLQTREWHLRNELTTRWSEIAGEKYAANTRPRLTRDGDLCVWVDEAALAHELHQKYRETLLRRARHCLGEKAVRSVRILVGQLR